jgi:hypothetical protein
MSHRALRQDRKQRVSPDIQEIGTVQIDLTLLDLRRYTE